MFSIRYIFFTASLFASMCVSAEETPQDLQLDDDDIRRTEALSNYAWGLFLHLQRPAAENPVASAHLQKALEAEPDSRIILAELLRPFLMRRDEAGIIELLEPIHRKHPANVYVLLLLAEALESQARHEEAIAYLRSGLETGEWHSPALLRQLFLSLWRQKRQEESRDLLRLARRKPSLKNSFELHHALTVSLWLEGRQIREESPWKSRRLTRKAIRHARQALAVVSSESDCGDIEWIANFLLIERVDPEFVLRRLGSLPQVVQSPELGFLRVRFLVAAGRKEEAVAEMSRLFEDGVLELEHYKGALEICLDFEMYDLAVVLCETYLQAYPDSRSMRRRLAWLLLYFGENRSALKVLTASSKSGPGDLRLSARAYFRLGEYEKAIEAMDHSVRLAKKGRDSLTLGNLLLLSRLCEKVGNVDRAIAEAREAWKRNPRDPSTSNSLGYLLADHKRNLDEAELLIRHAVKMEPENAAYRDSLAWVLFRKQNVPAALAEIQNTLRLGNSRDHEILLHAAEIYQAGGFQMLSQEYRNLADVCE